MGPDVSEEEACCLPETLCGEVVSVGIGTRSHRLSQHLEPTLPVGRSESRGQRGGVGGRPSLASGPALHLPSARLSVCPPVRPVPPSRLSDSGPPARPPPQQDPVTALGPPGCAGSTLVSGPELLGHGTCPRRLFCLCGRPGAGLHAAHVRLDLCPRPCFGLAGSSVQTGRPAALGWVGLSHSRGDMLFLVPWF